MSTITEHKNHIEIFVQGKTQDVGEFTITLNKWLNNHKHGPFLDKAVCDSDGKLTLIFTWYI